MPGAQGLRFMEAKPGRCTLSPRSPMAVPAALQRVEQLPAEQAYTATIFCGREMRNKVKCGNSAPSFLPLSASVDVCDAQRRVVRALSAVLAPNQVHFQTLIKKTSVEGSHFVMCCAF